MRPIVETEEFLEFQPTLWEQATNLIGSDFTSVKFRDMMTLVVSGTLTAGLIGKAPITATGLIIYGARALKDIFLRNIQGSEYISPETAKQLEDFFNSPGGKFFFTLSSAFFLSGSSVSLHNSIKDYADNSGNKELAALVNSASLLTLTSGAFTTAMIGNWAKIFHGVYKDSLGKDTETVVKAFEHLANHPMMVNIVASAGYIAGFSASEFIDPNYNTDPLIATGASGLALIGLSFMEKYREENKGRELSSQIRENYDHCFIENPKPTIAFKDGRFAPSEDHDDDPVSKKFAENLNRACNIIIAINPAKAEFLKKIPADINDRVDPESRETFIGQLVKQIAETLKPLEKATERVPDAQELAVSTAVPTSANGNQITVS